MKNGIFTASLAFSFAILFSTSTYSGTAESTNTADQKVMGTDQLAKKPSPPLTAMQKDVICTAMLDDFEAAKIKLEKYSKMKFENAYQFVSCKSSVDFQREWHLLGYTLTNPPMKQTFAEANRMLRTLKKSGDEKLIKSMFQYKDNMGRTIYDYLRIVKSRYPSQGSYYRRFEKLFNKYDQPNI